MAIVIYGHCYLWLLLFHMAIAISIYSRPLFDMRGSRTAQLVAGASPLLTPDAAPPLITRDRAPPLLTPDAALHGADTLRIASLN